MPLRRKRIKYKELDNPVGSWEQELHGISFSAKKKSIGGVSYE